MCVCDLGHRQHVTTQNNVMYGYVLHWQDTVRLGLFISISNISEDGSRETSRHRKLSETRRVSSRDGEGGQGQLQEEMQEQLEI